MNNDIDSRALRVITDWNSREYKSEGQKAARLQVLIIAALTEQAQVIRKLGKNLEALTEWIEQSGENTDTCTRSILGKICRGCRCSKADT